MTVCLFLLQSPGDCDCVVRIRGLGGLPTFLWNFPGEVDNIQDVFVRR